MCEISSQLSHNLLNRIFSLDVHSIWKHGTNFKAFFHSEWHSCSTWITHKICTGYLWYFMWFESGKSRHPNYWCGMLCLCFKWAALNIEFRCFFFFILEKLYKIGTMHLRLFFLNYIQFFSCGSVLFDHGLLIWKPSCWMKHQNKASTTTVYFKHLYWLKQTRQNTTGNNDTGQDTLQPQQMVPFSVLSAMR